MICFGCGTADGWGCKKECSELQQYVEEESIHVSQLIGQSKQAEMNSYTMRQYDTLLCICKIANRPPLPHKLLVIVATSDLSENFCRPPLRKPHGRSSQCRGSLSVYLHTDFLFSRKKPKSLLCLHRNQHPELSHDLCTQALHVCIQRFVFLTYFFEMTSHLYSFLSYFSRLLHSVWGFFCILFYFILFFGANKFSNRVTKFLS